MSKNNKRQYTQISQRIFAQYILSIVGVIAFILGSFFLARFIFSRFIWYASDTLYTMLNALEILSPFLLFIMFILGVSIFTYRSLKKPLTYLDAIIDAAKSLSHPTDIPIKLPAELNDVQNELNLVREQALRNISLAKESEQKKNDLVVYLAHDLKTPLTSIIGYLTLLEDEPQISQELRCRYTGIALEKAERLEDLINEFFDITRFNLTTLSLESERTNLSRMLGQITYEFHPVLSEKELTLRTAIPENIEILCDRDKMERVFDNLIRNAINYSYTGTEISLVLEATNKGVKIIVSNHGKTIPPDKLERIFEQFFRLDSSRSSATGGSGLGLAISKEIVKLHGGEFSAHSENETITFTLLLPDGIS